MMKEHDRREHLKTLNEDERKKEEEHYEEMKKKHADHPKVNHPVRAAGRHSHYKCRCEENQRAVLSFHTFLFAFAGQPESTEGGLGGS